ncbi:uncharacterized protein LOC117650253 [Thrips palmi]|uniref:Uncharacterized protein LOC117650253 n=1 Tax=Thrips palmi TaxID=161013 RepID=A0A6P8ZW68_THRPL|nr:uncharacterized protein LOC117650253 [Thrips palmi]
MELQLSVFVAAVATLLAAAVQQVHADMAAIQAVTKCAEDNKIKMETLMKGCEQTEVESEPGYKCFTKCVQQVMGVMDDSGKFNPEKSAAFVAEEDKASTLDVTKACAVEANAIADLCERASAANVCMQKKNPEIYKKSCMAITEKMMST